MNASKTPPIRVLIVDDHLMIRDGLRDLIESRGEMVVVGDVGDSAEALAVARRERPDIVVLDLDLGQQSETGLELLPRLLESCDNTSVIILTGDRDVENRDRAMELGAMAVIGKEKATEELIQAIKKVFHTGEPWFEPGAAKRLLDRRRSRERTGFADDPEAFKISSLTPTERELITCIGDGLDNKQIADRMHIAESTVRNNLTRIYDKLEIKGGRLGLLVYAYKHKLVAPSD